MPFATELIKYARSLGNIPKAQYVDHNDEVQSLNHSYKDIYALIAFAKSCYDYMTVGPVTLDLTAAVQISSGEWEIPLPNDVYSLRYIDYNMTGGWRPMLTFNINQRNKTVSQPMYRWMKDKLWVVGSLPNQIRIRYFPPPMSLSTPDNAYQYALSYAPYNLPAVDAPQYFSLPDPVNEGDNDYCIYVYGGTTITLESYSLNTTSTLYTGVGLSQANYWLGYVYYLEGGDIYRATTTLTSLGVPVKITTNGAILNYSLTADNKLVYSTASNTYFAKLDGSSPSIQYPYATSDVCLFTPGNYAYIKTSSDTIYVNNTPVNNAQVVNLASDGTYLYYLDQGGFIHRLTLDSHYVTLGDYNMFGGMQYMGSWWGRMLCTVDNQYNVKALSTYLDTELSYPINEAWELMAYQCAIDFRRKAEMDTTELEKRFGQIMLRFDMILKRDTSQFEHSSPEEIAGDYGYGGLY